MKSDKLFFILSIFGILIIIFVGGFENNIFEGEILDINYFSAGVNLKIEGINESVVIFSDELIDLTVGDHIYFNGREDFYRGQDQIIVLNVWK